MPRDEKHTPGDWNTAVIEGVLRIVSEDDGVQVPVCALSCPPDMTLDEQRANARIMESAPHMLLLLRQLVVVSNGHGNREAILRLSKTARDIIQYATENRCEECDGTGLHAGYQQTNGYTKISRCDCCEVYSSDWEAAQAYSKGHCNSDWAVMTIQDIADDPQYYGKHVIKDANQ